MSEIYGPTKEEFEKAQLDAIKRATDEAKAKEKLRTIFGNGTVQVSKYKDRTYVNYTKHPKTIRPRQRMIVMLHEAGWKIKDIAKSLGYTEVRVNQIVNSKHPELLKIRSETAARVADNITDTQLRIKLYANEMLDVMVKHARDETNAANSRMAARDILHMAGYAPVKKNLNVDVQVPGEELVKAASQIKEANEVAANYQMWSVKEQSDDDKESR
jgi:plasmid maintenance system antidote protein VapI